MEKSKPLFDFLLFGIPIDITTGIVKEWIAMAIIIILAAVFTRKLEKIPKGAQVWVEMIVGKINDLVTNVMGKEYIKFAPYIGSMIIFLLTLNLFGLTGFKPPTSQFSVTLGLAVTSFLLIQGYAFKKNGTKHYFKAMLGPVPAMAPILTPINVLERLMLPVSLSLRLFGNIFAASIIVELVYKGLAYISSFATGRIPILQTAIPIPLHLYFDIFDGAIQMFIFVMLTMVNIKITSEE